MRDLQVHFRRRFTACTLAIAAGLLRTSSVFAATVTWDGDYLTDNRWLRSLNPNSNPQWSNNNGPSAGDAVILDTSGASQTLVNNNYTLSNFKFDFNTGSAFLLGDATHVLTFSDATVLLGSNFPSNGLFAFGTQGATNRLPLQFTGNSTISVPSSAQTIALWGNISGSGGVTKSGAGILKFDTNTSYSGTLTVSGGTAEVDSDGALYFAGLIVSSGATASFIAGANNISPSVASLSGAGSVVFTTNTLTVGGSGATTFSGVVNGLGTLTKTGVGTLTLSGNNTPAATLVSAGVLMLGSGSALGGGPATVASGASLDLGGQSISGNVLTLNGTGYSSGVGALTNSITSIGASWGGSVTLGSASTLDGAGNTTLSGTVTGSYSLTKTGTGTLTLSNTNNSYSGGTSLNRGTLAIAGDGSLGTAPGSPVYNLTFDGGSGGTLLINSDVTLSANRSVLLSANATFNTNAHTLTIPGTIGGAGSLSVLGAGTLVLTGNNAYSGATTVNAGTLQIGSGGTTGSLGAGAVTNNAQLVFNRANALTVNNTISGAGTLTQAGSGTTTLTSAASYSGLTQVSAGTLIFSGSTSHSIGAVTGSGTLQVDAGATLTSDGVNLLNGTWNINGSQVIRSSGTTGAYGMHFYGQDSTALSGTSIVSNLVFRSGAHLDLKNNALIVEATSANMASLLLQIATDVTQGYITSSTATANSAYAVVVAVNNSNVNAGHFGGLAVDSNSIIVTEALLGDASLDGYVDLNDFNIWLSNLGLSGSAYSASTGDLNVDGYVDLNDYNIWSTNLGHYVVTNPAPSIVKGGSLSSGSGLSGGVAASAAPEPGSLALLGLSAMGVMSRRRSSRR